MCVVENHRSSAFERLCLLQNPMSAQAIPQVKFFVIIFRYFHRSNLEDSALDYQYISNLSHSGFTATQIQCRFSGERSYTSPRHIQSNLSSDHGHIHVNTWTYDNVPWMGCIRHGDSISVKLTGESQYSCPFNTFHVDFVRIDLYCAC